MRFRARAREMNEPLPADRKPGAAPPSQQWQLLRGAILLGLRRTFGGVHRGSGDEDAGCGLGREYGEIGVIFRVGGTGLFG